jgi:hypothetical protein
MGCQSEVTLGNNLTFSVCTHDPDTGVLTDADAAPAYRVYEDETGVAILTGTMAKLDNANTTGFYTEQIACTVANGFESGKSYTIYIEATVDSDTGGISYAFTVNPCGCSLGPGSTLNTYTVTDSVSGNPIQGVAVTVTTDVAGTNTIAYGVTDVAGEIDFWLDPGTYYMWSVKSGYTFTNPDTEVVT